jgi:formylmethanofuran dehydrogenase subunit E
MHKIRMSTKTAFFTASIFVASMLVYRSLATEKKKIIEIKCNKCNGCFITDKMVNYNGIYYKILCNYCHCGTVLVIK